ncbi:MAG: phage tail protein [Pseudomonadota bacterium]
MSDASEDQAYGLDILTTLGLQKVRDAATSGAQVTITQVALGDAGGVAYDPDPAQTALVNERLRRDIDTSLPIGKNAWQTTTVWPPETETVTIREIGFFDADGDLICLWAGADLNRFSQTGVVEYELIHVLDFRGVQANIVVVEGTLSAVDMLAAIKGVDGAGSGLDADLLAGKPAATYVTQPQLQAALQAALDGLIDGAPGTLDTLNELATLAKANADLVATLQELTKSQPATDAYLRGAK